jgi:hypothetical protein
VDYYIKLWIVTLNCGSLHQVVDYWFRRVRGRRMDFIRPPRAEFSRVRCFLFACGGRIGNVASARAWTLSELAAVWPAFPTAIAVDFRGDSTARRFGRGALRAK